MTMTDNAHRPGRGADIDRAVNDPGRMAEYEARTRDLLDLLALSHPFGCAHLGRCPTGARDLQLQTGPVGVPARAPGPILAGLAVVTAQVASSFVTQGPSRVRPAPPDESAHREVTLAELNERLARIERLLTAIHPGSSPGAIDSD
jgi:hypothetical protein